MYYMKKSVVILALLFILILSGCRQHNSYATSESFVLSVCGSYSVPGMFCFDLKGDSFKCEVLETDSKGRILFLYTTESIITNEQEQAVVVCQKYDENYVYFYEDQSYIMTDFSSEQIERLKRQNDWDQQFDEQKMSKRPITVSLDLTVVVNSNLDFDDARDACANELGLTLEQINEMCLIDANGRNDLYWLVYEANGFQKSGYLIISNTYECAFLESDQLFVSAELWAKFKEDSGWWR